MILEKLVLTLILENLHEQLKEVIKYCKHDVEQTIQVFMKRFEGIPITYCFNTNF